MSERGIVEWFDNNKKFGFILKPDGSSVFVHFSDIQEAGYKTLKPGDLVEFDVKENGPKGPRAINVKKVCKRKGGNNGPGNGGTQSKPHVSASEVAKIKEVLASEEKALERPKEAEPINQQTAKEEKKEKLT